MRIGREQVRAAVVIALGAWFWACALSAGEYASLPGLIQQALDHNPGVAASAENAQAAKARVSQAKSPPDPMLELGAMSLPVDSFRLDREPMTQLSVGVSQEVPYPGKLGRMGQARENESKAQGQMLRSDRQELVAMVRRAYYGLADLDQAVDITGRNRDLMQSLARIAEAKYSVGLGIQQDVLKAHVEFYRMDSELIAYQAERDKQAAELTRLVNGDTQFPVGPAAPPGPLPPLPDRDQLLAAVRERNSSLMSDRAMAAAAGDEASLAKLAARTDPTVSLAYGFRQDTRMGGGQVTRNSDLLSAEIAIPIPLWKKTKQDQMVAEKEAIRRGAQQSAADRELALVARADQALAEARGLSRQIALLEAGMIPEARASLESARAGYQTSKVDFITLLDNQVTLYRLELQLAESKAAYFKALAELDFLSGKPIEEILKEVEK